MLNVPSLTIVAPFSNIPASLLHTFCCHFFWNYHGLVIANYYEGDCVKDAWAFVANKK